MDTMTRASGWAGSTGRAGFNGQLQHLWQTRPVRLPHHGPGAGVAAGFGRRYGVDPVLVRVAFVVSTIFGGSGIVLYLLGWLLLPAAQDQVSAAEGLVGRGHSTQSPTKTVVLIVALLIAVSTVGPVGAGLGGAGLISFALMLAGWWLLYLRQPQPPADDFEALTPDAGFAATGYPGAMFPGGSPWGGTTYGPYTRLPDHYEPDHPKDAAASDIPPQPTEVIAQQTTPGAGDTAVLSHDTAVLPDDAPMDAPVEEQDSVATGASSAAPSPGRSTDNDAAQRITPSATPFRTIPDPSKIRPDASGWDPLGVSPTAWDLPDPNTPPAPVLPPLPPRRARSRLTPVVIGLAIVAATAAGVLAAVGVDWMTPGRIGAVALAVVGLGLIVGAFLRRGYGLLALLAPLAGFVVLASLIGPVRFDRGAMGDHTWTPATVAELQPSYRVNAGDGTLDLRSLSLTENRTVKVEVRAGDFHVLVPNSMRLDATCRARMGDVTCPQGLSGPPTGPVLTLDVDVHAGDAEVTRG
ncbi:phage shock protein PspC (stress-responsive transcriptional regulator) [Nocardia sp. GAS34]